MDHSDAAMSDVAPETNDIPTAMGNAPSAIDTSAGNPLDENISALNGMDDSTLAMGNMAPVVDNAPGATKAPVKKPLDEFHPFDTMTELLREHVLKFADNQSLFNYAQCSSKCNEEIQKYNTKPPKSVNFKEDRENVLVFLSYAKPFHPPLIEPTPRITMFKFPKNGETMDNIEQFLQYTYQNVREGNTTTLSINLKYWPRNIMESGIFFTLDELFVSVYNTMLSGFVEFVELNQVQVVEKMQLTDSARGLPFNKWKLKKIFNSQFFQQVPQVIINLSYSIDDEDFLSFKNRRVLVKSPRRRISDVAIRAKVFELAQTTEKCGIMVLIPSTDPEQFDYSTLFPAHYHPRFDRDGKRHDTMTIGNVCVVPLNTTTDLWITRKIENNDN